MLVRAKIQTDWLKDTIVFPIKNENITIENVLQEIHKRYHAWHSFGVYEFEFDSINAEKHDIFLQTFSIDKFGKQKEITCEVIETENSRKKREEDRIRAEEERKRQEEEARIAKEKKEAKIRELLEIGNCWEFSGYSPQLDVPLEESGKVVVNRGIQNIDMMSHLYFSLACILCVLHASCVYCTTLIS